MVQKSYRPGKGELQGIEFHEQTGQNHFKSLQRGLGAFSSSNLFTHHLRPKMKP